MRKYLIAIVMICSAACAQEEEPQYCDNERNNLIHVGASYSYLWLYPEGEPSFQDSLYGIQGIYEYLPSNAIYQAVKFSWRQGNLHADPVTRFLLDFDVHQRIGYTYSPWNRDWGVTGFTGLGYRYLGHKLSQPTFETVHLNYNEFYIPVGIRGSYKVSDWIFGLSAIWMPHVFPSLDVDPLGGANWIVKRTLANFLVEMPVTYSQCRKWQIEFKPFFQYWQNGQTIAKTSAGVDFDLPTNTYLFIGAEVNFGWAF